jgi:threonine/homoserine/homoserine lactone efflux protein
VAADVAAFLGVSLLVIVTPGQDTVLTIRNTLVGGRRGGVFTALGVSTGQATWTVATSAGLAALLVASELAFTAVKAVGAAYLVFLGAQALRDAFFRGGAGHVASPPERGRRLLPRSAFRQGVVSNLGNPKMAVFFTSLLPQFTPAGEASFAALLGLGIVFCSLTLAWLTAYAFAVARAGDFLRRSRVRRTLDAVAGAALVGLGVRLATEQR